MISPPTPDSSQGDDSDKAESLRFGALLAGLAVAILVVAGLLIALPTLLGTGSPLVYLIAYGIGALFGPIGFSLLASAWRIRNRAVHGKAMPDSQRRGLRILGAALIVVGLFLILGDFGVSGRISRVLNLVWGISLGLYGVRFFVRSYLADPE